MNYKVGLCLGLGEDWQYQTSFPQFCSTPTWAMPKQMMQWHSNATRESSQKVALTRRQKFGACPALQNLSRKLTVLMRWQLTVDFVLTADHTKQYV